MSRPALWSYVFIALAAGLPSVAHAHAGIGGTAGFAHGFMHPVNGLDHVLAMMMVGVFAWQLGGRARWLVPATFVVVMAVGGALGAVDADLPFVEAGIAASVVVLGAIVAFGMKAPVAVAMAVVGLFAVFHGYAHGGEMPVSKDGIAFGLGFLLATSLLHAGGIGLGFLIGRAEHGRGAIALRATGAATALAGVVILTGTI